MNVSGLEIVFLGHLKPLYRHVYGKCRSSRPLVYICVRRFVFCLLKKRCVHIFLYYSLVALVNLICQGLNDRHIKKRMDIFHGYVVV